MSQSVEKCTEKATNLITELDFTDINCYFANFPMELSVCLKKAERWISIKIDNKNKRTLIDGET